MKTVDQGSTLIKVNKMKILQIVKWLSPIENTGGKIRSFCMGKMLSSFAMVDVAGFVAPGETPTGKEAHLSHYNRLYPFPIPRGIRFMKGVFISFGCGFSLRTARFLPEVFGPLIQTILRENHYDAVQVEELPFMAIWKSINTDIPVVFSSHNVESELSRLLFRRRNPFVRLLANVECRRTMREERKALARARASVAVSEKDRDSLIRLSCDPVAAVHVLPNCAHERIQPSGRVLPGKGMLSVGAFGWYPNREGLGWFVDKILPLLRKKFPDETIRVVGSEMDSSFRWRLKRQGIEVYPDVSDTLPYLQEARLLFVPLRIGGGTRIKIVEAWAAGLPVVSTSCGAEGLPCRSGVNILIADDEEEFAAAIGHLLTNDDLYQTLRQNGLDTSRNLRWSSQTPVLTDIYRNILKDKEGVVS